MEFFLSWTTSQTKIWKFVCSLRNKQRTKKLDKERNQLNKKTKTLFQPSRCSLRSQLLPKGNPLKDPFPPTRNYGGTRVLKRHSFVKTFHWNPSTSPRLQLVSGSRKSSPRRRSAHSCGGHSTVIWSIARRKLSRIFSYTPMTTTMSFNLSENLVAISAMETRWKRLI